MLQNIRDKITGAWPRVFLGAIALVFMFWGKLSTSNGTPEFAAKVNGEAYP